MTSSLSSLLHAGLALVSSIGVASSPITLPLPQDVNYQEFAASQIYGGNFSSDPTVQGRVLQSVTQNPTPTPDPNATPIPSNTPPPNVQPAALDVTFIKPPCPNNEMTFQIIIENVGDRAAANITTTDEYPNVPFLSADRPANSHDPVNRVFIWREPGLAPGAKIIYTFTLRGITDRVTDNVLTVSFSDTDPNPNANNGPFTQRIVSEISGICFPPQAGQSPPAFSKQPLPPAQPVIICDPAESSCLPSRPTNLGINFNKAKPYESNPELGVRYKEAYADIIPGECRVIPDNDTKLPEYHDALNRKSKEAAPFMFPLYQAGQDFVQMNHENELDGITFFIRTRIRLAKIHTRHWVKQKNEIQKVFDGSLTTNDIRVQIDPWNQQWIAETKQEQVLILEEYKNLIEQRKAKFDPVAQKAVDHAKDSMQQACDVNSDGGLAALLTPDVKLEYDTSLDDRLAEFQRLQDLFSDPDNQLFPNANRASTWQAILRRALDAYDQGNEGQLRAYLRSTGFQDQWGFSVAWSLTYETHRLGDTDSDNTVRLNFWEIALDTPKEAATECELEKVSGSHVVTTWCESGDYPELIIKGAPVPAKVRDIAIPDTSAFNGASARINPNAVKGKACTKDPGDPWWADDCSCQCGDIITVNGAPTPCEADKDITRHDYFVTSAAECLNDGQKHDDPFF